MLSRKAIIELLFVIRDQSLENAWKAHMLINRLTNDYDPAENLNQKEINLLAAHAKKHKEEIELTWLELESQKKERGLFRRILYFFGILKE